MKLILVILLSFIAINASSQKSLRKKLDAKLDSIILISRMFPPWEGSCDSKTKISKSTWYSQKDSSWGWIQIATGYNDSIGKKLLFVDSYQNDCSMAVQLLFGFELSKIINVIIVDEPKYHNLQIKLIFDDECAKEWIVTSGKLPDNLLYQGTSSTVSIEYTKQLKNENLHLVLKNLFLQSSELSRKLKM